MNLKLVALTSCFALTNMSWHLHAQDRSPSAVVEQAAVQNTETGGEANTTQPPTSSAAGQFALELQRIIEICQRLGLSEQAETTEKWLPPNRPDCQQLYLPTQFPVATGKSQTDSWRNRFIEARKNYAEQLFLQAKTIAARDERSAFRLVWHTLRENPEHAEARRVLGPLMTGLAARPQQRLGIKLPQFASLGAMTRWQTPHVQLYGKMPNQTGANLIQQIEQFICLWQQTYYELWAKPGILQARLRGDNQEWPNRDRIQVIVFGDRDDYLKILGVLEKNIAVSVGYYNFQARMSFFYLSDDLNETLNHELTHQLFSEQSAMKVAPTLDKLEGAWCIEGVAIYMESLRSTSTGCWLVGGLDARRLQTARYRALRDQYWPEWKSWSSSNLAEWTSRPDVALWYSHAAGLTHLFLDILPMQPDNQARITFLDYVQSVYQRNSVADDLLMLLGGESAAPKRYRQWMTLTEQQLEILRANSPQMQHLVLSRSSLDEWQKLAEFSQLRWLDISYSNCTDQDLLWLESLMKLDRLSLEGTRLNGSQLQSVARIPQLNDLDISGCPINDDDLSALAQHPKIQTLWLTGTKITDRALRILSTMPKLQRCDISQTSVTPEAWAEFLEQHPKIQDLPTVELVNPN